MHGAVPQNYSGIGHAATNAPVSAPAYYLLNPHTGAETLESIADVQITTGTTAVPANSCLPSNTTYNTATMSGLTATSALFGPTPTTDVNSVTGWNQAGPTLYFVLKPTANTLNWQECNNTSSSITPSASVTWNVGAR